MEKKNIEVFSEFYDEMADNIYRFIFFKVGSREEAEDLTSKAFMKLWDRYSKNNDQSELKALIYTISRNLVIDYYRVKKQNISTEEILEIQAEYNLENIITVKQDFENITKVLKEIKKEYREILVMRFVDELEVVEIAKILNKDTNNVRVLLHRALNSIKKNVAGIENN